MKDVMIVAEILILFFIFIFGILRNVNIWDVNDLEGGVEVNPLGSAPGSEIESVSIYWMSVKMPIS